MTEFGRIDKNRHLPRLRVNQPLLINPEGVFTVPHANFVNMNQR
jgi:hypothetical protein